MEWEEWDVSRVDDRSVFEHLRFRVRDVIGWAEQLFGPRVEGYVYKGIGFHRHGPRIQFPEPGQVQVMLSHSVRNQPAGAFFELSHEVVHLLAPVPKEEVTFLEEGLATWFSLEVMEKLLPGNDLEKKYVIDSRYERPFRLTAKLMAQRPNLIAVLREQEPYISRITNDQLTPHLTGLSDEIAFLTQRTGW